MGVAMQIVRVRAVTVLVMPPRCNHHEHGVQGNCHRDEQRERLPFRGQVIHSREGCKRRAIVGVILRRLRPMICNFSSQRAWMPWEASAIVLACQFKRLTLPSDPAA